MKKTISVFVLLLLCLFNYGQKSIDKLMAKYKVQSIEVNGHKFTIKDTITLNNGTLPDGGFMSARISSDYLMEASIQPPHLPSDYINHKFIITNIYRESDGLNTQIVIVFNIDKSTSVWLDPTVAINKKEILLK